MVAAVFLRLTFWTILVCAHLTLTSGIYTSLEDGRNQVAFLAAISVLAILVMLKFRDHSIARDVIDIGMIELAFFGILLFSYFFNKILCMFLIHNVYNWLLHATFITTLMRIMWTARNKATGELIDWPKLGLCRALGPEVDRPSKASTKQRVAVLLSIGVVVALSYALTLIQLKWSALFLATSGFIMIGTKGRQCLDALTNTVTEKNEAISAQQALVDALNTSKAAFKELEGVSERSLTPAERRVLAKLRSTQEEVRFELLQLFDDIAQSAQKPNPQANQDDLPISAEPRLSLVKR